MDWQLTCRVCLETGDMVSLFDWDENNEQLGDKYTFCCGVEVSKNDSLPTLICLNCVDRLTFAYQFKQQCLSSNETLKECLEEFLKTSAAVSAATNSHLTETETITIKQENGLLLQYELPVEHDPEARWTRTLTKTPSSAVVTKAPGPRKRGRPRKYPNEQGQIDVSPYQRKKPKVEQKEPEALTTLLASGSLDLKQEPTEEDEQEDAFGNDGYSADDPDFEPGVEEVESEPEIKKEQQPRKRGRPRKVITQQLTKPKEDDGEDVLLKETIMAYSEPIPEHILNPKPKVKKPSQKKKYIYEKTHTCETCGASFTSNASLQAHIRRHLGIKPFVCSVCGYACVLNMELRRHMMRHTGVRPYKCRVCDRRFGDFGSRQKHERLHMGLRPYQCSLCGKAFTYSYVLANHMLTHTGEKKYSCGPCNKKFTKAHHLKYHNKVHHKELYIQQQLELEAKKLRQQMNVTGLSGVISGQIVDGTLQIIQAPSEDGEQEAQMQVVEEREQDQDIDEDKETDKAVADMQAINIMPRKQLCPKPGTRRYGTKTRYTEEQLKECLDKINNCVISQRVAAELYDIPRSTLKNKLKEKHNKNFGRPPILTEAEETAIVSHIIALSDLGIPISILDVRVIVKKFLDGNQKKVKIFKENLPGWEWGHLFLERHPCIKVKVAHSISRKRAQVNKEMLEKYFNNLSQEMRDVVPENIYNFDETGSLG